ncbi:hypothetical protein K504DRAFT_155975 [Pleomassaria siparia CBS 279.74]|uniref:Uncharacterized protein n=1 Tax=Pleomassaria siparia CBS 279.74 TaxID=1314801 RepID=A0A6G1KMV6_9PLEO|nr:hypothetical protein K504DRAFT_155975 [Pleomassaria siparia CBS 279.74]
MPTATRRNRKWTDASPSHRPHQHHSLPIYPLSVADGRYSSISHIEIPSRRTATRNAHTSPAMLCLLCIHTRYYGPPPTAAFTSCASNPLSSRRLLAQSAKLSVLCIRDVTIFSRPTGFASKNLNHSRVPAANGQQDATVSPPHHLPANAVCSRRLITNTQASIALLLISYDFMAGFLHVSPARIYFVRMRSQVIL